MDQEWEKDEKYALRLVKELVWRIVMQQRN